MPNWQKTGEEQSNGHRVDQELILAAQQGDAGAFGSLYERHAPAIFRFIYSHVDNRLDAEDLTGEVFLRVWRALQTYRDQGVPFAAYLFRVARNVIIDFYRQEKPSRQDVSLMEDQVIPDDSPDPIEMVIQQIDHQGIRDTLGQLREDYRMVLALRFLGDLSPDEAAAAMGKSSGAVRVLQHRALAALRKLLET